VSRDLIISCAGLRRVPSGLPWAGEPPILLAWPGVPTPSGHPSWKAAARELRGSDGAMLDRLIGRYRRFIGADLSGISRIAVVGFSAGSNSGVRELLRSPLDRARISFVAAIDGLHPMLARRRVRAAETDPTANYADWPGQMAPFAEYGLLAAEDQGAAMVCTASGVSASRQVAPTGVALASLYQWIAAHSSATGPWLPPEFPPRESAPALRAGEQYPTPSIVQGARRFVAMWYQGRTARAHELQAYVVAPDVLRAFLVPYWGGADPILVGHRPDDPTVAEPGPPPEVTGLPFWTPAALGAFAGVASAFI
jgi:hypothetical protein